MRPVFIEFLVPLAWPLAFIFFILFFKNSLNSFISRITEVRPQGAKATPPLQSIETKRPSESVDKSLAEKDQSNDPSIEPWVSNIK